MPSSMVKMETSKVPPPRSKIKTLHSADPFFLKYGNQACDEFGKACTAAGNAAMTYMNIQSLGAKGLVKKTAKNTGKNIAKNIVGMGSEERKEVTQAEMKQ